MKRFFKLIAIAALTAVMALATLVACETNITVKPIDSSTNSSTASAAGDLNSKPTAGAGQTVYTFTVVYPDGTPCKGVKVIYCTVENGVETNCRPTTQVTDSQGKIYQALATGEYHIHVQVAPTGYTDGYDVSNPVATSPAHVTATVTEATITLSAI